MGLYQLWEAMTGWSGLLGISVGRGGARAPVKRAKGQRAGAKDEARSCGGLLNAL